MSGLQRKYFLISLFLIVSAALQAQQKVMHLKIEGEINTQSARYVELALESATELKVNAVLVEVNTFGGLLDEADQIRTRLLECKVPVFAFINKNAASAGALISIACDSIYMAEGANIGAATVVLGETGEAAPDKYQSYMRSLMRSTAQANHRNPLIAEGMVDQHLKMDTLIKKNEQVITFTTAEAIRFSYCEGLAGSVQEVLVKTGYGKAKTILYELSWLEKAIAYFLNPAISSILIMLILGGIYYEMQAPGLGFPIIVSICAALFYLLPYYLHGLAANWEMGILLAGLVLIGLEVFVIPGFGVAGFSGLALLFGGLVLIMLDNDFLDFTFVSRRAMLQSAVSAVAALLGAVALLLWSLNRLAGSKRLAGISLQGSFRSEDGYTASGLSQLLAGKTGTVLTELRPIGKVEVEGEIYSAICPYSFLEKGTEIEVTGLEFNTLKVRRRSSGNIL